MAKRRNRVILAILTALWAGGGTQAAWLAIEAFLGRPVPETGDD